MKTRHLFVLRTLLLITGCAVSATAVADFELTTPAGRRILLKDNGTWQYLDPKDKPADAKTPEKGEAILKLESKADIGPICRMSVQLMNNLPYEIRSLVLYFAGYRANGVAFETVSPGNSFNTLSPGASQRREFEFTRTNCKDIARVQVISAERCDMGELTRFSSEKGQCLARLRIVESDLVRFEK